MPEDQPSATPGQADPTQPPEAPNAEGESTGTLNDPPNPGAADAADDLYDKAFDQFLSPDAPETPAAQQGEEADQATEGESAKQQQSDTASAPKLEDNDVQLLKRLHMTPEMIAGWSPEQQRGFLDNAAKREADQTRTFKDLSDRLKKVEESGRANKTGDEPGERGEQDGQEAPAGGFAEDAQKVVDDAANVFGEEIKPLGELTLKLGQTLDQVSERLNRAEQTSSMKDGLIVEMTIDSGIRDLVDDYPSLNKADARQRVVDRFKQDWSNPENPHRKGQDSGGSILQRVRAAIADAAKAEFGSTTESAAQVALHNQTKQRLKNQPEAGSGKGRKAPVTEDDVYDQAFEKHLKPELK